MDIRIWIVAVLIALSVGGGIYIKIRSEARKNAFQEIENKNNTAGSASDDARSRFDLCPDGLWDYGSGKCKRP